MTILYNAPAPNVPFFTPAQYPASGSAVVPQPDGKHVPKLFQPLRIRGVEFQNRIWVSVRDQFINRKREFVFLVQFAFVLVNLELAPF